jgi:O-methyltransferase involved in polyketide biosynthesis
MHCWPPDRPGQLGAAKTQALRVAAAQAVELWDVDSAIAIDDLAAEIATEVRLLYAAQAERARHEQARDTALARVDPAGLAASLPVWARSGPPSWWPHPTHSGV